MRAFTRAELIDWCSHHKVELDTRGEPVHPYGGSPSLRCDLPNLTQLTWFCRLVERTLRPRDQCLLWVTTTGVWPSSENWHLYYRLRQAHGDLSLIDEAPGHLFLEFEEADLVSFLAVGLIAGWDMHVIPTNGYGRAFVSHHEWVEFAMDDPLEIDSLAADLTKANLSPRKLTKSDPAAK
jgi:hypothetical protein